MTKTQLNQSVLFSAISPIVYLVADIYRLPLFTYFPAVNEFHWGWVAMNDELGPGMYWYGWIATAFFVSGFMSVVVVRGVSPDSRVWGWVARNLWVLPIVLLVPLIISLKFYWR